MELIQPIADLLGVAPGVLVAISVLGVLAVVGWYTLKAILRITWKLFVAGIVVIGLGLLVIVVGAVLLGAVG